MTIVGQTEIYNRETLIGPFLVHKFFGSQTPPPHLLGLRYVMPCHVMSCHVMSCHVMSCEVMSCHVKSCHATWAVRGGAEGPSQQGVCRPGMY